MDRAWIARVFELEEQGRVDEARKLFEQNTAPGQWAELEKGLDRLAREIARLDPEIIRSLKFRDAAKLDAETIDELEQIMKRLRVVKRLPDDDPKKGYWTSLLPMTLAQARQLLPLLLKVDPLKTKGRPARSKIPAEHFAEMTRRTDAGEKKRTAAKAIVGNVVGADNKADHLVKMWKKTVLK